MIKLFVNIDHVATLREARKTFEPDPLEAALLAEKAGAYGITAHLREDRRHIQDDDIQYLKEQITTPLNLEMAAVAEMIKIAIFTKPYQVSIVPENRQEITTEGGLKILEQEDHLTNVGIQVKEKGIFFSLFIDPSLEEVKAAKRVGADSIELNTGPYSVLTDKSKIEEELARIREAAKKAGRLGLRVFAGHGLSFDNVKAIAAIPEIEELNIGHFLVAQSVYIGIEEAVKIMKQVIKTASS